ncbi:MAG: hypothetical protein AM324_014380 [Candidatus Thorarchaeota archaeon SMTZ1-83]
MRLVASFQSGSKRPTASPEDVALIAPDFILMPVLLILGFNSFFKQRV